MGLRRADVLPQSPAVTTFGPCGFGEEIVLSQRGLGAMEVLPLKWVPQVPRILGTGDHVPFTKAFLYPRREQDFRWADLAHGT